MKYDYSNSVAYITKGNKFVKTIKVGEEYTCKEDETLHPAAFIPKNQRYSNYISGPSGSGKSTIASKIIEELAKTRKFKYIVLITSSQTQDPSYERINYINLPDEHLLEPIETFKDSIIIADDYDMGAEPDIVAARRGLIKAALEQGRKLNIAVLTITHNSLQGHKTRDQIFESNFVTLFPSASRMPVRNFIKDKLGFTTKSDMETFTKLVKGKRWVLIHMNAPNFMMTDRQIILF